MPGAGARGLAIPPPLDRPRFVPFRPVTVSSAKHLVRTIGRRRHRRRRRRRARITTHRTNVPPRSHRYDGARMTGRRSVGPLRRASALPSLSSTRARSPLSRSPARPTDHFAPATPTRRGPSLPSHDGSVHPRACTFPRLRSVMQRSVSLSLFRRSAPISFPTRLSVSLSLSFSRILRVPSASMSCVISLSLAPVCWMNARTRRRMEEWASGRGGCQYRSYGTTKPDGFDFLWPLGISVFNLWTFLTRFCFALIHCSEILF